MAVPWTLLTMLSLLELGNALKSTTRPVVLPLQRPQRHVERHGITMASGSRVAGTICSSRQMRDLASREFSLAAGQSDVGVVHLKDLSSTEYVGVLGVGSNCSGGPCRPAAELYVVYDTGSADLWVASDLCTAGPCTRDGRHRFNRSTSSTFQQDQHPDEFQTDYASGRLAGVLGRDQVWVGPYAAQSALGLISEESGSAFSWMPIDGIVGLGFEALSVKTKPLMDSLLQENALPLSEFAFFLYKDVSKGGVMIWGNAQQLQLHQEPLQWFPVAQEKYWSLLLRGFRLGRNSTNDLLHLLFPPKKRREDGPLLQTTEEMQVEEMPSAHLLMDSGTTFFTAPPRLFNEISRFIWPSSCHHLQRFPELVFTVGTDLTNHSALAELVIPPEVYMVRSPFDHSCVPGIMNLAASPEDPPMMILGEVFMRHRFSIYRRGRVQGDSWVGWAPAKPDADVEALLR